MRTIGLITRYLGGLYVGNVIAGAFRQARQRGVRLIVVQDTPANVHLLRLGADLVDGWMTIVYTEGAAELAATGAPVVTISGAVDGLPKVLPDNRSGMRESVEHLIGHGHRRIAFIGHMGNADVAQRFAAYRDALASHDIPFDQQLVVDVDTEMGAPGADGVRALLASGQQFSALVAGTDFNALGALEALRAAGLRVPEDVALVGFDDIEATQTSDPPLTTTRQNVPLLGSMAVDRLLEQIADPGRPADTIYTPTALVLRRSCGCAEERVTSLADADQVAAAPNWRVGLAQQLVRLISYPFAPDLNRPLAHLWPGVADLIDLVERALDGREPPAESPAAKAWGQAVALTSNIDLLTAAVDLIDEAAMRRVGDTPGAMARLMAALRHIRAELARATMAYQVEHIRQIDAILYANNEVSTSMLQDNGSSAPALSWLRHTAATWGCIGLWSDAPRRGELVLASTYRRGEQASPVGGAIATAAFPPFAHALFGGSGQAESDITTVAPLRTDKRDWGLLVVAGLLHSNVTWNADPFAMWVRMLSAALDRAALLATLRQEQEERQAQQLVLQAAYDRERALASTVRELGSPVIPLLPGVLLIPLIGAIDAERADQIIRITLDAVGREQASDVIVDVTGVPVIDTQVAAGLVQMARMIRLLGARTVLVGIRPEIAQSIVGLGIDLAQLVSAPSVAAATQIMRLHKHLPGGRPAHRSVRI